tara:strand:- start:1183 stop:1614 length:432 start_codon:yes stop_codon:yes gene_type:complete
MPYADPEKKREYQKAYNKKYYRDFKDYKNLVTKAVKSKNSLRTRKQQYLLSQLGSKCMICGFDERELLTVKTTPQTHLRKWGETGYKSLVDYSWDDLDVIWPTLKIICGACAERQGTNHKQIQQMLGEDLPVGYTLDDDLSLP